MNLRKGFRLREVAGEYILLPMDSQTVDMNVVFTLSESAAWLWKALQGREFTEDDAVSLILDEYEVDEGTARTDVSAIIAQWRKNLMLDD